MVIWHFYLMAGLYIVAGLAHWVFPRIYIRVMPPWVPYKAVVVWGSGLLEILLGLALFHPALKEPALWGIMGMLVLFLPVHTHMLRDQRAGSAIPLWILVLRLPLQGLLIWWAGSYL